MSGLLDCPWIVYFSLLMLICTELPISEGAQSWVRACGFPAFYISVAEFILFLCSVSVPNNYRKDPHILGAIALPPVKNPSEGSRMSVTLLRSMVERQAVRELCV